ncbi:MAG: TolC family protein [Ignavibacteria bacterium]|nr:TolC family protein [Ignavibacteria bacterium]MCU7517005.1 TolC family protein [Ignavibacteria bacterium]
MKIKTIIFIILALLVTSAAAQEERKPESLSLRQCLSEGLKSSREIINLRLETEKSTYKIKETQSQLLPQVQAFGTYDNYLKIPVQMVPGEIFGQPGTTVPISLYVQHNVTGGLKAAQMLYNQTIFTAMSLANKAKEISEITYRKAGDDLIYEVSSLFFLIKLTDGQAGIYRGNIERLNQLLKVTQSQHAAGLVREVDIDRIKINLENLGNEAKNLDILQSKQLEMLFYTIGLHKVSKNAYQTVNITLSDSLGMPLLSNYSIPEKLNDLSEHNEMQLLAKRLEMVTLNRKLAASGFYPTLSIYGQYFYQGQREKFDFFSAGQNKWSDVGVIGLSLSIPVFDGLQKNAQINQAEVDYLEATNDYEFLARLLNLEYNNAVKKYFNSKDAAERQKDNVKLAAKVYSQTLLQYRQGVASLSDLLEIENSSSSAQLSLMNALYQLRISELDILKATGKLQTILN